MYHWAADFAYSLPWFHSRKLHQYKHKTFFTRCPHFTISQQLYSTENCYYVQFTTLFHLFDNQSDIFVNILSTRSDIKQFWSKISFFCFFALRFVTLCKTIKKMVADDNNKYIYICMYIYRFEMNVRLDRRTGVAEGPGIIPDCGLPVILALTITVEFRGYGFYHWLHACMYCICLKKEKWNIYCKILLKINVKWTIWKNITRKL